MTPSNVFLLSLVATLAAASVASDPFSHTLHQIRQLDLQTATDIANGSFSEAAFRTMAQNYLAVVKILKDFPVEHIQNKLRLLSSGFQDHPEFAELQQPASAARSLQNFGFATTTQLNNAVTALQTQIAGNITAVQAQIVTNRTALQAQIAGNATAVTSALQSQIAGNISAVTAALQAQIASNVSALNAAIASSSSGSASSNQVLQTYILGNATLLQTSFANSLSQEQTWRVANDSGIQASISANLNQEAQWRLSNETLIQEFIKQNDTYINNSIATLQTQDNSRFAAIESVNTQQTSQIGSLDTRVTGLEGSNAAQDSSIGTLNQKVATLETEQTVDNQQIEELDQQVQDFGDQVVVQNAIVGNLSASQAFINTSIANLNTGHVGLYAEYVNLNATVATLVAGSGPNPQIDQLQAEINALNTAVAQANDAAADANELAGEANTKADQLIQAFSTLPTPEALSELSDRVSAVEDKNALQDDELVTLTANLASAANNANAALNQAGQLEADLTALSLSAATVADLNTVNGRLGSLEASDVATATHIGAIDAKNAVQDAKLNDLTAGQAAINITINGLGSGSGSGSDPQVGQLQSQIDQLQGDLTTLGLSVATIADLTTVNGRLGSLEASDLAAAAHFAAIDAKDTIQDAKLNDLTAGQAAINITIDGLGSGSGSGSEVTAADIAAINSKIAAMNVTLTDNREYLDIQMNNLMLVNDKAEANALSIFLLQSNLAGNNVTWVDNRFYYDKINNLTFGQAAINATLATLTPGSGSGSSALQTQVDQLSGRVDTLESTTQSQGNRLTAVEDENQSQDNRLTAVEGVAQSQGNRLTAVEGVTQTEGDRLTAVEGVTQAQALQLQTLQQLANNLNVGQAAVNVTLASLNAQNTSYAQSLAASLNEITNSIQAVQATLTGLTQTSQAQATLIQGLSDEVDALSNAGGNGGTDPAVTLLQTQYQELSDQLINFIASYNDNMGTFNGETYKLGDTLTAFFPIYSQDIDLVKIKSQMNLERTNYAISMITQLAKKVKNPNYQPGLWGWYGDAQLADAVGIGYDNASFPMDINARRLQASSFPIPTELKAPTYKFYPAWVGLSSGIADPANPNQLLVVIPYGQIGFTHSPIIAASLVATHNSTSVPPYTLFVHSVNEKSVTIAVSSASGPVDSSAALLLHVLAYGG